MTCLLYTSDAADEEDSVDLGGRRIIKKKLTISVQTIPKLYCGWGLVKANMRQPLHGTVSYVEA